ncbi:roundabout homolog 1-like isoform X2 [Sitodiplosis mosellana]|uniref:roundabout homolog 1-like isoform X2 n=1 Tax=Sitodiplosis mosellana TaxID=263140 RepID=UPI002444C365|nr:roundabout homolog 1-like isoform X2 [Sitodiplosis mosellana]
MELSVAVTFMISVAIVGVVFGPSLASESDPVHQPISSLADTSYPKQNQYFDSTNMAYVLELSNSKTNQNDGGDGGGGGDGDDDDDDEDDNRNSNDSDNIRSNQKYVNVSSRDRNFYNNNNNQNIGDDADKMNNALNRGPFFDVSASKNVTALVGKTANLNCRIKNLGNKTVTWIRHRDLHLLTVDKTTYTSDNRFVCVNNKQIGDWSLQIRNVNKNDSDIYECQVSTTPPVGFSMILSVVEPVTTILGGQDLYIDILSTINLTCIVRHLPEPPSAILWSHKNQEINYDSPRGGVSVITEKGEVTTSYLLIQKARISDSGKYTCMPTHANPSTVNVHVLNEMRR